MILEVPDELRTEARQVSGQDLAYLAEDVDSLFESGLSTDEVAAKVEGVGWSREFATWLVQSSVDSTGSLQIQIPREPVAAKVWDDRVKRSALARRERSNGWWLFWGADAVVFMARLAAKYGLDPIALLFLGVAIAVPMKFRAGSLLLKSKGQGTAGAWVALLDIPFLVWYCVVVEDRIRDEFPNADRPKDSDVVSVSRPRIVASGVQVAAPPVIEADPKLEGPPTASENPSVPAERITTFDSLGHLVELHSKGLISDDEFRHLKGQTD